MRAQAARAPTRGGKRKRSRARAIPAHSVARRYIQGYVGAFLRDGFGASGLVLQIAHEIAAALPEIFRGLRVTQAWAYKYDEAHARGIDAHADQAKVSVNLWITDDAANVGGDDAPGGLVVYDRKPPAEWSFAQANSATDDIDAFLEGGGSVRIPYRWNRCLLFRGERFHRTDALRFRPGYRSRRINVTFLFN